MRPQNPRRMLNNRGPICRQTDGRTDRRPGEVPRHQCTEVPEIQDVEGTQSIAPPPPYR